MFKNGLSFLMCFILTAGVFAQTVKAGNDAEAAYLQYVSAWKAKDLATLQQIIADDYMTLNGQNKLATKQMELSEAKSDGNYDQMEVTEIHSLIKGDTAVLSGLIAVAGTDNGKPYKAKARFLATLLKRGGHWQLVADQSAPSS